MSNLSELDYIFLTHVEKGLTMQQIAEAMGISYSSIRKYKDKLKDEVLERARDRLTFAAVKAANTVVELLDANANTEKGELRMKAAEQVMDRVGITRHTSVEVQVESENGLFILPAKAVVPTEQDETDIKDTE